MKRPSIGQGATAFWAAAAILAWANAGAAQSMARLPVPPEPEDATPRLRGAELQAEIPDLTTSTQPPKFTFTILAPQVNFPFQWLAMGTAFVAQPLPWLYLRGTYSIGISPTPNEMAFSQYADAFLGYRMLDVRGGERKVDIPMRSLKGAPPQLARVPNSHGLYVEGGFLTGFFSLYRCVTNCSPRVDATYAPAPIQYVLPAFGLRYQQFSAYASKRRNAREVFAPSIFLHIVLPAVNAPDYTLYNLTYNERGVPPIGVRVGAQVPIGLFGPCLASFAGLPCAQGRFSLGLAPLALPIFFETSLEFPIYFE
jgi:hypothetical protein